jgi:hypothetical protein
MTSALGGVRHSAAMMKIADEEWIAWGRHTFIGVYVTMSPTPPV